jgi:hypothetical protein
MQIRLIGFRKTWLGAFSQVGAYSTATARLPWNCRQEAENHDYRCSRKATHAAEAILGTLESGKFKI